MNYLSRTLFDCFTLQIRFRIAVYGNRDRAGRVKFENLRTKMVKEKSLSIKRPGFSNDKEHFFNGKWVVEDEVAYIAEEGYIYFFAEDFFSVNNLTK